MKNPTTTERISDCEVAISRTVNAPARLVFDAWAKPELFLRWWFPKSVGIMVFEHDFDIRTGGHYRLVLGMNPEQRMTFHGRYTEVTPHSRLVWTNEESDQGSVTTVSLQDSGEKTLMIVTERFPSKDACDAALASGELERAEAFDQLEELLTS